MSRVDRFGRNGEDQKTGANNEGIVNMHRITLLVGLCTTFLLMTAACDDRGPAQHTGGGDQVVEENGGVIANLYEAEPLEQVDPAMD
jgi:hypothetical protein